MAVGKTGEGELQVNREKVFKVNIRNECRVESASVCISERERALWEKPIIMGQS